MSDDRACGECFWFGIGAGIVLSGLAALWMETDHRNVPTQAPATAAFSDDVSAVFCNPGPDGGRAAMTIATPGTPDLSMSESNWQVFTTVTAARLRAQCVDPIPTWEH